MAWFLFVDESGHDCSASPYEVLAGVAIQDRAVRQIIQRLHQEEVRSFGRRYSAGPEPFFVHSDLTTGVQIADLVAYVISWGFRTSRMIKPARSELSQFSAQVANLRYRATRSRMDNPEFGIWSFARITDLRTQAECDGVP